ncbi:MAG: alpha,alpha-trehalase TreF [Bacteroidia bacterium]|nr:alpha,alpha-trehalase TreF [Bacteroidia bacterium]
MAKLKTPEDIYGDLFRDMHRSGLWEDGKQIADLIPRKKPKKILDAFAKKKEDADFDLKSFVEANFKYTAARNTDFKSDTSKSVEDHIESLWPYLLRKADKPVKGSSLIPLPHPYIVPGGRFQEIYYWDSYFTMLGLVASERLDIVESMVKNFAHLIQTIGHIPNGNRTYYSGRSQPPFFACMVQLLAEIKSKKVFKKYLPALLLEYQFWMKGKKKLRNKKMAYKHVVRVKQGILNRYWDDFRDPRAEMYGDDIELQEQSGRKCKELYGDIRSACESGWDFSSRWFADPMKLETIQTTQILPVDLNCLLYNLELMIAKGLKLKGKKKKSKKFKSKANARWQLIQRLFWDNDLGIYTDYNFIESKSTGTITAATAFPLFFSIANREQAEHIADIMEKELLKEGGLVTTNVNSGQQWDAPNGWAPLQWIAIQGLRNYGYGELANTLKERWIALNTKVYKQTGKLLEKYDVMDLTKLSGGGEYPVQDGFGWTNGVLLAILREERGDSINKQG